MSSNRATSSSASSTTDYELNGSSNSSGIPICPLCMEDLDGTDRDFFPCPCDYQVCIFCLEYIKTNLGGKCPACRQQYDSSRYRYLQSKSSDDGLSSGLLRGRSVKGGGSSKQGAARRRRDQQSQSCCGAGALEVTVASTTAPKTGVYNLNSLKDIRVIQRNLCYVLGLPLLIAKKEELVRPEFFGRYGTISNIVVARTQSSAVNSYSAYVTYSTDQEAIDAIRDIDGSIYEGRVLRSSFGTTKYCSFFLRGVTCVKQDCFYLHHIGRDRDSFTREEMSCTNRTVFSELPKNHSPPDTIHSVYRLQLKQFEERTQGSSTSSRCPSPKEGSQQRHHEYKHTNVSPALESQFGKPVPIELIQQVQSLIYEDKKASNTSSSSKTAITNCAGAIVGTSSSRSPTSSVTNAWQKGNPLFTTASSACPTSQTRASRDHLLGQRSSDQGISMTEHDFPSALELSGSKSLDVLCHLDNGSTSPTSSPHDSKPSSQGRRRFDGSLVHEVWQKKQPRSIVERVEFSSSDSVLPQMTEEDQDTTAWSKTFDEHDKNHDRFHDEEQERTNDDAKDSGTTARHTDASYPCRPPNSLYGKESQELLDPTENGSPATRSCSDTMGFSIDQIQHSNDNSSSNAGSLRFEDNRSLLNLSPSSIAPNALPGGYQVTMQPFEGSQRTTDLFSWSLVGSHIGHPMVRNESHGHATDLSCRPNNSIHQSLHQSVNLPPSGALAVGSAAERNSANGRLQFGKLSFQDLSLDFSSLRLDRNTTNTTSSESPHSLLLNHPFSTHHHHHSVNDALDIDLIPNYPYRPNSESPPARQLPHHYSATSPDLILPEANGLIFGQLHAQARIFEQQIQQELQTKINHYVLNGGLHAAARLNADLQAGSLLRSKLTELLSNSAAQSHVSPSKSQNPYQGIKQQHPHYATVPLSSSSTLSNGGWDSRLSAPDAFLYDDSYSSSSRSCPINNDHRFTVFDDSKVALVEQLQPLNEDMARLDLAKCEESILGRTLRSRLRNGVIHSNQGFGVMSENFGRMDDAQQSRGQGRTPSTQGSCYPPSQAGLQTETLGSSDHWNSDRDMMLGSQFRFLDDGGMMDPMLLLTEDEPPVSIADADDEGLQLLRSILPNAKITFENPPPPVGLCHSPFPTPPRPFMTLHDPLLRPAAESDFLRFPVDGPWDGRE